MEAHFDTNQTEEDNLLNQDGVLQINDGHHDNFQDPDQDIIDIVNDDATLEKLSRTTNESCSTPDSIRNNFENTQLQVSGDGGITSQGTNNNFMLNIQNKTNNNNSMRNNYKNNQQNQNNNTGGFMNYEDGEEFIGYREDLLMSEQYNTQTFNTGNQSPCRDSIRSNSMGQRTSGFPMNLEETQNLRMKELGINHNIEDYIEKELLDQDQEEMEELMEQEAAFAEYNDQQIDSDMVLKQQPDNPVGVTHTKIKEFEKSFLIKFEEFVGDNSMKDCDTNRKASERVSDRIYESINDQSNKDNPKNDYSNYDEELQLLEKKNRNLIAKNLNNKDLHTNSDKYNYYGLDDDDEEEEEQEEKEEAVAIGNQAQVDEDLERQQFNGGMPEYQNVANNQNQNQFNSFVNGNLFVIAEEEASQIYSEDVNSNYQTFNRLPSADLYSNGDREKHSLGASDQPPLNISYTKSRESAKSVSQQSINQKSKSHGYTKNKTEGFKRNIVVLANDDRIVKTDNSPTIGHRVSTNMLESHENSSGNHIYSNNNPQQYDQDQLSQYFGKINNSLKHGNYMENNINNFSDEDLLSNVDRISKIIPSNEYMDYVGPQHEDIIYYQTQMKTLQEQIEDMNILLYMKKQELKSMQERNEQLEENIRDLQQNQESNIKKGVDYSTQTITMFSQNKKDSYTQTDHKIRAKDQSSMNNKKSPSRIGQAAFNRSNVSQEYSNDNLPLPMMNNTRKQSLKQSPSSLNAMSHNQSHNQNVSFTSDDMKSFQQQQQLIMQLKNQLQKADSENLGLLEKSNNFESKHIELEQYLMRVEQDKQDIINKLTHMQAKCFDKERNVEGLSAENLELKRNLDSITAQHSPLKKMERNLSAIKLITVASQDTQTPPVGQKLDDSYHFEYDHEHFSTYSSKDEIDLVTQLMQQPTPTPTAHQQQDLQMLMDKAKDYEQLSLQLQSEIQDHRKSLKENQDKFLLKNLQQYKEEAKRKIKKRESKIERLNQHIKEKDKENEDLKKKAGNLIEKIQDLKIKMESKVQEKEFKILTLKNQLKHFANSGFITPVSNGAPPANISFTTQKDMLTMINEIIKQQLQQQQDKEAKVNINNHDNEQLSFNENSPSSNIINNHMSVPLRSKFNNYLTNTKQRAKSYENSQYIQKRDDLFNRQLPSHGGGVGCGFGFDSNNQSNQGGGHNQWNCNEYINQIIMRSHEMDTDMPIHHERRATFMSKGSNNTRYNDNQQNISFEIQKETSQPLKQIFNSSLKRINKELESIKELNSQAKSQSQNTNNDVFQYQSQNNQKQIVLQQKNQTNNQGNLTFEDSLQDDIRNEGEELINKSIDKSNKYIVKDQDEDDCQSSYISNQFDERFKQLMSAQANQQQQRMSQNNRNGYGNIKSIDYQRHYNQSNLILEDKAEDLLPTFQRPSSFKHTNNRNTTNSNLFMLDQSQPNFGQTLNFDVKEQNESIFYDLKPQFDNSNYSSSSITENNHQNMSSAKNTKPFKYQQPQSNLQNYQQFQPPKYSNSIRGKTFYKPSGTNNASIGINQDLNDHNNKSTYVKDLNPRLQQKLKNPDMIPQSLKVTQVDHFNQGLTFEEEDKQLSARRNPKSYGGNARRDTNKPPQSKQGHLQGSGFKPSPDNHQQQQFLSSQYNSSLINQKQYAPQQIYMKNQQSKAQVNGGSGIQTNISNYVSNKSSSCSSSQRLEDLKKKYGRIDNNNNQ